MAAKFPKVQELIQSEGLVSPYFYLHPHQSYEFNGTKNRHLN